MFILVLDGIKLSTSGATENQPAIGKFVVIRAHPINPLRINGEPGQFTFAQRQSPPYTEFHRLIARCQANNFFMTISFDLLIGSVSLFKPGGFMINLMISDSDLFAREGIKQMLAKVGDIRIACETSTVAETLDALREYRPDVCIMEIAMAGAGGLQFIRKAKSQANGVPILVISHRLERDFALRAIRAGAVGYITKECMDHQLVYAVRMAADHRPYISETVCEMIAESFSSVHVRRRHENLSDSDFEIFCLMANGAPMAKVASTCNMSIPVIRTRKAKIMRQLELRTDADLVKYAVGRNLID